MATKSIYKDVRIKDRALCHKFVSALENAKGKQSKPIFISKKVSFLNGEQIKALFKGN